MQVRDHDENKQTRQAANSTHVAIHEQSLAYEEGDSSQYCYQVWARDDPRFCWDKKPTTRTGCTASSGKTTCLCPEASGLACGIPLAASVTGKCVDRTLYVDASSTSASAEVYCSNMRKDEQWSDLDLLPTDPESNDYSWVWCVYYSYTWHEGKCYRPTRYLGESCWDGYSSTGSCASSTKLPKLPAVPADYKTSCYNSICVPTYITSGDSTRCTCAYVGVPTVPCTAANNKCGGHPCVSIGVSNSNRRCDWAGK